MARFIKYGGYHPNSDNLIPKWYPLPIKQPRGFLTQGWHKFTLYNEMGLCGIYMDLPSGKPNIPFWKMDEHGPIIDYN